MTEYALPPADIVDVLDAPLPPDVYPSPDGDALLLADRWTYPPVERLARPWLGLAGVRVDPALGGRRRIDAVTAMTVVATSDGAAVPIRVPDGSLLGPPQWSPDATRVAFTREAPDGIELWVAEARTGDARALPGVVVNDTVASVSEGSAAFAWSRDSRRLLVALRPADAGEPPSRPATPTGPRVEETEGKRSEQATFQDLLRDGHDDEAFAWFARSQLAFLDPTNGAAQLLGHPDLYLAASESPDGTYVALTRLRPPLSHRVPYLRFARTIEVWTAGGEPVATVAELPVADEVPRQGVPTGPRRAGWAENEDATLIWVEALDGGDPLAKVEHRERVLRWRAPFAGQSDEIARLRQRFVAWHWLPGDGGVLVTEYDRDRRWQTTSRFDPAKPAETWQVLFDRSVKDLYGDPGMPVVHTTAHGRRLAVGDGSCLWLRGPGAGEAGLRPFLDRFDLRTGETDRVFQSEPDAFESVVRVLDPDARRVIVGRERRDQPTNFFLRTPDGERQLTHFQDQQPALSNVHRQILRYRRPDGVALSGTLYLPPGREPGDGGPRLPLLVWAYPEEFSDGDTAGQVRASEHRFLRVTGTSPLVLLLRGWAVLLNATMPVIGDPEHMNDTYVEQITTAAEAAIDCLDGMGVIDRRRVVASGHSYGGFMTANLLAHSDLFAAGIARSGAYNRSLTPFGFQTERRSYWEVPDLYHRVSPYDHAEMIKSPILLIHGAEDSNAGTYPIQSERLFQALQGLGGTARLVILPAEEHGYRARESVLHVAAETLAWVDKHAGAPDR